MKCLLLLFCVFLITNCTGQGILKRLPKPDRVMMVNGKSISLPVPITINAWRLTGPIAGFMYPQNQVVTGLGYGFQRLHWVDSTQRYYTNYSISLVAYAGGNVTPSAHNIMSVGVSMGFLNQLLMVGPCYNFTNGSEKGSAGVVFNISMPLN